MHRPCAALVLAAAISVPSLAGAQQPARPDLATLSGGLVSLYRTARANLIGAAELMPEEHYGFKPVETVDEVLEIALGTNARDLKPRRGSVIANGRTSQSDGSPAHRRMKSR